MSVDNLDNPSDLKDLLKKYISREEILHSIQQRIKKSCNRVIRYNHFVSYNKINCCNKNKVHFYFQTILLDFNLICKRNLVQPWKNSILFVATLGLGQVQFRVFVTTTRGPTPSSLPSVVISKPQAVFSSTAFLQRAESSPTLANERSLLEIGINICQSRTDYCIRFFCTSHRTHSFIAHSFFILF